jgi:arginyl-tRNA--protein-N-Asp/Glu arginylyltransferase
VSPGVADGFPKSAARNGWHTLGPLEWCEVYQPRRAALQHAGASAWYNNAMQHVRPVLGPDGVERLEQISLLGELEEPCPYLPGLTARFRFLDGRFAGIFFRELMDFGYRRNGNFIYRPVCEGCNACQVLRMPVADFKKTKEQRRVWNRGSQLFTVSLVRPVYTDEKASLYLRYLKEIHGNERETLETSHYSSFLVQSCLDEQTYEIHVRHEGRLVGVGLIDLLDDALSSVYFFYDPDYQRYSLGTFSIMAEFSIAERLGMAYYYPGYYIAGCAP